MPLNKYDYKGKVPEHSPDKENYEPVDDIWSFLNVKVYEGPEKDPDYPIVIFLHGLGGSNRESSAYSQYWFKTFPKLRVLAPSAPLLSIDMNFGMEIPAWFNLQAMGKMPDAEAHPGWHFLHRSIVYIRQLIDVVTQKYNIPSNKIILGGFSQGAALAISLVFNTDIELAGLFSFSGFFPNLDEPFGTQQVLDHYKKYSFPLFHGHGTVDEAIPYETSVILHRIFTTCKAPNFTWKKYAGMNHIVSRNEMKTFVDWMKVVITHEGELPESSSIIDSAEEIQAAAAAIEKKEKKQLLKQQEQQKLLANGGQGQEKQQIDVETPSSCKNAKDNGSSIANVQ